METDTTATEIEVARMLGQEYRRRLLHSILESLLRDVEIAETAGVRLFDWRLEVSERAEIKLEE